MHFLGFGLLHTAETEQSVVFRGIAVGEKKKKSKGVPGIAEPTGRRKLEQGLCVFGRCQSFWPEC